MLYTFVDVIRKNLYVFSSKDEAEQIWKKLAKDEETNPILSKIIAIRGTQVVFDRKFELINPIDISILRRSDRRMAIQ